MHPGTESGNAAMSHMEHAGPHASHARGTYCWSMLTARVHGMGVSMKVTWQKYSWRYWCMHHSMLCPLTSKSSLQWPNTTSLCAMERPLRSGGPGGTSGRNLTRCPWESRLCTSRVKSMLRVVYKLRHDSVFGSRSVQILF